MCVPGLARHTPTKNLNPPKSRPRLQAAAAAAAPDNVSSSPFVVCSKRARAPPAWFFALPCSRQSTYMQHHLQPISTSSDLSPGDSEVPGDLESICISTHLLSPAYNSTLCFQTTAKLCPFCITGEPPPFSVDARRCCPPIPNSPSLPALHPAPPAGRAPMTGWTSLRT